MSAVFEDVPFSELLHRPAATTQRLDAARALRLRRRGTFDLALMRVEQLEQDQSVVHFTAQLLAALVRTENTGLLRKLLPDALPWVTFLPDQDIETLLHELITTARGASALDNLAPIALLLAQWRHSAEIHADPALHAAVTREPEEDLGSAEPPPGDPS